MCNYVMIDGKKFMLNAEQSKDILRSVQNTGLSPSFLRAKKNKNYFYIDSRGTLVFETDSLPRSSRRLRLDAPCRSQKRSAGKGSPYQT